ncbi:hypothetical protein EDB81DRAFT_814601 [Dactylonectria macrodidyma]|uniref:Rhodopsin domain-containing protein n=1 Tax=Dactylonectria macrodidyma TaxID=307937 RepID=A0A9P9DKM4_9HYPO|nr:hypothetical protein EDB81DRAFT_814601 [Dactylonectria macrodidyma]
MSLPSDVKFGIAVASVCGALILFRCGYRLLSHCKSHASCHRTWHADDAYMAFALLPLAGRTACIALSFVLNPAQVHRAATQADAAAENLTVAQLDENHVMAYKLLIPSRICYALFLWCLKLCLLSFYSRFVHVLLWGKAAYLALWWFVVLSFLIILIPTLAECRPLHLMWDVEKHECQRAVGNLITMAAFNIVTDVALIIFPFPILRYLTIDRKARLPLIFLFCVGGFVTIITIIRLPMILNQSVSQRSRSLWASIEVLCACIVANTAFFYALFKDIQRGHDSRVGNSRDAVPNSFYIQSIRSTSRHVRESHDLENLAFDDTVGLNGRPISVHSVR